MDESTNQVIFIVVGVIIAYIIESATKLVSSLRYIQKINWVHIGYCLMTPLVVWQFAYQLPKTLTNSTDIHFLTGLWVLINVFLMAELSKLVYPDLSNSKKASDELYVLNNSLYREYLRKNRRPFYFVLSIYLFSMTLMFRVIGIPFDTLADGIRITMALFSLFFAVTEFKSTFSLCSPFRETNYMPFGDNLKNRHIQIKYNNLDKAALLFYAILFGFYLICRLPTTE